MNEKKLVSIIGGNGFLGSYVVNELLNRGYYVKIISRSATLSKRNFTINKPGQLKFINCDIKNYELLENLLHGTDYVINLVGLLVNKKNNSFKDVHSLAVVNLVKICEKIKIKKLIHISAIGVDKKTQSSYAKTKYNGEKAVERLGNSCIIRPSIIFGDEDNFINFFAKTAKNSPFLPLIGGGQTLFQPIWVKDTADIIIKVLESNVKAKILEVGGEDIFSFREILEEILKELQLKRKLISIPFTISKKLAFFLEKLPGSVLTRDQVEMLKVDNIITAEYDYRKHIKYLPFPFKKILKRQLIFLKKEGGHFS